MPQQQPIVTPGDPYCKFDVDPRRARKVATLRPLSLLRGPVSGSTNAGGPPHPYRAASIVVTAVALSRSAEIRWRRPQWPEVRSPVFQLLVQGSRRRLWRSLGGRGGNGCQPAMTRAHSRACTLSVMPGNSRRNSIAADNSPCCSNVARIAAASASVTTNMQGAW